MVLARAKLLATIGVVLAVQAAAQAADCLCTDTGRTLDAAPTGGLISCSGGDCYSGYANHTWNCTPPTSSPLADTSGCRTCARIQTYVWTCFNNNGNMVCNWASYPETNTTYQTSGTPSACNATTSNYWSVTLPPRGSLIPDANYKIVIKELCYPGSGACSDPVFDATAALVCQTTFYCP